MSERRARKTRVGRVVSDRGDKTVVVEVGTTRQHPLYAKTIRRQRKLYAHDEANTAHKGDLVRVMEARPMSKLKRWLVVEVVERARE